MGRKFERLLHYAEIKEGKLVEDNPSWFRGMLSLYDDCKVSILVERRRRSKSQEQLGYYWGVVLPEIASDTGHSVDELHDIFKSRFLRKKKFWRGRDLTTIGSTQNLSVEEMRDFITLVIAEANEMGIEIPPSDQIYQFR